MSNVTSEQIKASLKQCMDPEVPISIVDLGLIYGGIDIEDNVQIGSHCSIYSHSTINNKQGPIILKKNCKIGTHSTIMPNVTIGENSVIAAYSFVKKNLPKNQVWVGVPAKFKAKIKS